MPVQSSLFSEKVDRLIRDMRVQSVTPADYLVSSDKDLIAQFIQELSNNAHSQDDLLNDAIKINKIIMIADQRMIDMKDSINSNKPALV